MSKGTLIVGASHAGVQIAASLRELGYTDQIVVAGAERWRPYHRPPLSKAYLSGHATADSITLRSDDFYARQRIELALGSWVTEIDLNDRKAILDNGTELQFDRLALAVGGRPRRMSVPGSGLRGVLYLRDMNDANRLGALLPAASSVVVVGGGFIGLEAAAVARGYGKSVTVVEAATRLIARAVAPIVSDFYRDAHIRRGTEVIVGRTVSSMISDRGDVSAVELDDGSVIPADLVLVGIGIEPRTELATQMGLDVCNGIVVDRCARTCNPRVVAAGDCAAFTLPDSPTTFRRLESVQNAVDQSAVAAASITGAERPYTPVPRFWSDQADLKLQIAGLSDGYDQYVLRGDPATERFSVLYYRENRLIAAHCVNRAADYMIIRRALGARQTIPADCVTDTEVALKSLFSTRSSQSNPCDV
jgi:3-phenylpropionate/trans-cinnamate dioxygenase ferredoxin reductase subunit